MHCREMECKSTKSRDTWSKRQVWPWSIKWSREKANRVLSRECTGHSKCPLPTTQETTLHLDITGWSILKSDWLYSLQPKLEKLYIVSKNKTGSWLWIRSWTPYCKAPITDPKKKNLWTVWQRIKNNLLKEMLKRVLWAEMNRQL